MTVISRQTVTEDLRDWLRAETGLRGETSRTPADGPWPPDTPANPYWILYPLPGGGHTGPAQHAEADATFVYQVTVVGERADQIEGGADRVRAAMLGRGTDGVPRLLGVTLGTVRVMDVEMASFGGVDDVQSDTGSSAEVYALSVTTS